MVSTAYWGATVLTWIYNLHATLALGEPGCYAVGALGLVLLAAVAAAFPLAWPGRSRFTEMFRIRRAASPARWNYDLHRATGSWTAALLALLAVTGFCMVYGEFAQRIASRLSPPRQPLPLVHSSAVPGARRILASAAVAAAQHAFPDGELKLVRTPAGPEGTWQISLRQPGELNHHYPATTVWVDAYSAAVLATRDPRRFGAGEAFLSVLYPLHNGGALGSSGRVLVFLSGVAPLLLLVTGVRAYLRRRRARTPRPVSPAVPVPPASVRSS